MYHRVTAPRGAGPDPVQPGMHVSASTFRSHVDFLKDNFRVLPLSELVSRIADGGNAGGCCSITFDDGWRDNFENAFPVLREYGVPATIFLASGYIGTDRRFWPDELACRLRSEEKGEGGGERRLERAIEEMKSRTPCERERILENLRADAPVRFMDRVMMTWDEAREMRDSGLAGFGAHTVNHVILDQVPLQEAESEIARSREEIEGRLDVPIDLFAYPNGNFNRDLQGVLARNKFRGAVTTGKGWIGTGTDPLEIPRIGMHEDVSCTLPLFLSRILLKKF